MLKVYASIMQQGMGLIFGLLLLVIFFRNLDKKKAVSMLWSGVAAGTIAGVAVYLIQKWVVRLEWLDAAEKGLLCLALVLLFLSFPAFRRPKSGAVEKSVVFLVGFSFTLDTVLKILLAILPMLSLVNGFNSEWIFKTAGALLGLLTLLLLAVSMERTGSKVSQRFLAGFVLVMYLQLVLSQLIEWAQLLFGLRILPLTMWVLNLLTPLVNHKDVFFNILLALMAAFFVILTYQLNRGAELEAFEARNPAEARKRLAGKRRLQRWFYGLTAVFVLMFSAIIGNQVNAARALQTKPPISVTAQNGIIQLGKSEMHEKKLNVYSYQTEDGTQVRFLTVRKGGENFGVALDACQICGAAGYYQKGDQIICKLCESVVSTTTVGFPGGCNPIPIQHQHDAQGHLVIPVSEMEKAKESFR